MLRYRSGICIDYATLMDTLCELAGITNVSIYGYAKDEVFDLNDSIYVDNHAWNAVKLNGDWFVYDVTWASGNVDYRYTKFSQFLIKLSKHFPTKYKKKKVRKRNSYFFIDECGNEFRSPSYYYKEKSFNPFMQRLLGLFSLSIEQYYTQKINKDYYLTEPELFSVSHMADNPVWALTAKRTMRDFEMDSLYYHLNDSSYVGQSRSGRSCPECDYDLSLDDLNKQHYLRNQSLKFNKRNRFITSMCEYFIGNINYRRSFDQEDSATKVAFFDTSVVYLQNSKGSLKQSYKNVDIDFILQKSKNKYKQMLLLTENREHINFVKSKINITLTQKQNIRALKNKSNVNLRKYNNRKSRIRNLKSKIFVDETNKLPDHKAKELHERFKEKQREIDSLTQLVEIYKGRFDSIVTNLSLNVWQKVLHHDSLVQPIVNSTELRKLLKDNLKKPVVEIRKQIPYYQANYERDINDIVYTPARVLADFGAGLFNLIDKRNNYEVDCFQAKLLMAKFNLIPLDDLSEYKTFLQKENKLDYCWLKSKIPSIKAIAEGFAVLKEKQKDAMKIIVRENETERTRTHFISKELLRRKKKYRRIVVNNSYFTRVKLNEVKKERRGYLNLLKKQRREAAKKTKE
ncbi:MAG: hypothetical protein H0U95_16320 [Bacteroidetes bacterium]|nr:hypothetical protein [Bacteroidota bacterium]